VSCCEDSEVITAVTGMICLQHISCVQTDNTLYMHVCIYVIYVCCIMKNNLVYLRYCNGLGKCCTIDSSPLCTNSHLCKPIRHHVVSYHHTCNTGSFESLCPRNGTRTVLSTSHIAYSARFNVPLTCIGLLLDILS